MRSWRERFEYKARRVGEISIDVVFSGSGEARKFLER